MGSAGRTVYGTRRLIRPYGAWPLRAVILSGVGLGTLTLDTPLRAESQAPDLYAAHCAVCHGTDRLGGVGPALLPENLKRLRRNNAAHVIRDGRAATQMPGFAARLNDAQVDALVELIYTPLAETPVWGREEIARSRTVATVDAGALTAPRYDADARNLFVVVEAGDHHATILDGDRFAPLHRLRTRFALHGGPKFSPDGRYVYFASRDGWITKYDLYALSVVAEIRAGINTRNIAVSGDGRFVMAANYLPHTLVLLSGQDLALLRVIPVSDAQGNSSRVSAVYAAPPRESFIAALKDLPEVWEISYDEGPPDRALFPIRRIRLDDFLDDFFFDPAYEHIVGAARNAKNGQVVNLLAGRKIADVALTGLPHLGSGISWEYEGRPVLATPNLKEGVVSVIDMRSWKVIKRIDTLGPGFFMRSHENTRYAWVDVFFGPHRDAVHVIDKRSLEIVQTLRPAPGKTAAHVEFTADGRHALVSIWDPDGAIVVYDSTTLEEVKRIPMNKPSGKYNVHNKITRSAGTSH